METLDPAITRPFFQAVVDKFKPEVKPSCFVTTHLLRDRPYFLDALSQIANIISLTPKPKSIHHSTFLWLSKRYPVDRLDRSELEDVARVAAIIVDRADSQNILFVDVGGYYCGSLKALVSKFGSRILGVVEDTENGHQRYLRRKAGVPIVSVARSPLKNPEDFLVGQSIVFSAEAIIRQSGDIMQGRRAAVLGYGKLGRSIASTLRERHVETVVVEPNPVRAVEARSHGFHVAQRAKGTLSTAGLVFCATGSLSLGLEEYTALSSGCYVATATSSDDELDTASLKARFRRRRVTDFISRYESRDNRNKHFYLLNHGQAVNFLHGATVGPFIYLVQAEIIAAAGILSGALPTELSLKPAPGVSELGDETRTWIAQAWLDAFRDGD